MNLRLALVIALLGCIRFSDAQECLLSFSGKVFDKEKIPLEGATISLQPGSHSMVTGQGGVFDFHGLCPGKFLAIVRYVGLETERDSIVVNAPVYREYHLEQDALLETVVIHGDREPEAGAQVISTLHRTQLDAEAGKSLGESLRSVSGVNTIQAGPGIFKPVIHGVHSQRILILNNGVRQEGQQWGAEHAPEIDPFTANDIQVIKDASAIRYGVDAIGGVVLVNPPDLPEAPGTGGFFHTTGQSNGRGGTISGSLQGGLAERPGWGWRVQGTKKQLGDFHAARYNLSNTGIRESDVSGGIGYHRDRGGIDLFASRFNTDIGILSGTSVGNLEDLARLIGAEIPANTLPFTRTVANPRQDVTHSLTRLRGHLVRPGFTWRMQYAWQRNARKEFDVRRSTLSGLPAINLQLDTHTLDTECQPKTGADRKILFGLNGMYQYNRNIPGTQRIPFIPDFVTMTGGAYAVFRKQTETFTWDLGARADLRHYSIAGYDFSNTLYRQQLNFANISATAGLSLKTAYSGRFSTSLSSAWRPPHVAELFSLGTHQSAAAIEYGLFLDPATNQIRNANEVRFRNEQAIKWVAEWKGKLGGTELEVSTYANLIFNYFWLRPGGITTNTRGAYPFFRYNQSNALFTGTDVELTIPFAERLKISSRTSLIRAADITNHDFLSFIPASRSEVRLRYEKPNAGKARNVFAELTGNHVFRQWRAPRTISPADFLAASRTGTNPLNGESSNFDFMAPPQGYFLLNARIGFSVPGKRARYDFLLSGDNLLNTSYREYTNRFRYYADDLGRNIRFSFKVIF